jgi:ABC-type transport system involved in cytochrome c biogenesis permease subunit
VPFTIPLAVYVAALLAYGVHFARRTPGAGRAATTLLVAGALAHTFVIGMQTMEAGHVPFAGTTQAISTFVWVLALAYLYTEVTTDERGLGVFVLAIIVALQSVPAARGPAVEPQSPVLAHPLFWTHVAALLGAYASFGLAAVIGITYVLQFKEIKAKHLVFFFNRLPSLQALDVMNSRTVLIGWVLMTVGLGAGALWVTDALLLAPGDPRVQAMSLTDPKIFVAIMTWAVYAFQLVARRTIGWRGRRAAYLSAVGFAIVLLNFVLVSYFLTDSHNFGTGNVLPNDQFPTPNSNRLEFVVGNLALDAAGAETCISF